MPDNTSGGFGDLLGALGNANPFAPIAKTMAQLQRGASEFLATIENFNATMEQFNRVATRVNEMLDLVEEPVKAFIPQITRTVRAADMLVEQLSAPVDRVAPGLNRLAETLSAPVLTTLPKDLGEFVGVLGDLARRLQPLGQMAETAGGLFAKSPWAAFLPGAGAPRSTEPPAVAPHRPPDARESFGTMREVRDETTAAEQTPGKKPPAKAAPVKKITAKKSTAAKTRAKRPAGTTATRAGAANSG